MNVTYHTITSNGPHGMKLEVGVDSDNTDRPRDFDLPVQIKLGYVREDGGREEQSAWITSGEVRALSDVLQGVLAHYDGHGHVPSVGQSDIVAAIDRLGDRLVEAWREDDLNEPLAPAQPGGFILAPFMEAIKRKEDEAFLGTVPIYHGFRVGERVLDEAGNEFEVVRREDQKFYGKAAEWVPVRKVEGGQLTESEDGYYPESLKRKSALAEELEAKGSIAVPKDQIEEGWKLAAEKGRVVSFYYTKEGESTSKFRAIRAESTFESPHTGLVYLQGREADEGSTDIDGYRQFRLDRVDTPQAVVIHPASR